MLIRTIYVILTEMSCILVIAKSWSFFFVQMTELKADHFSETQELRIIKKNTDNDNRNKINFLQNKVNVSIKL